MTDPTSPSRSFYARFGKRALDLVLSLVALVVLSPVIMILAAVVRIRLGSPILFRQERPGMHGRPFHMMKFRTMTDTRGSDGELLPDAQRLPAFGRLLRSTSLDELPELANVLMGQMSLVGPRPLLMKYLPLYSERQMRRHEARPGISGWAQVNGRNALSWEDRFELDVWYVEHMSAWLDVMILFRTLGKVVVREGVSQAGHVTMEEFRGTGGQP